MSEYTIELLECDTHDTRLTQRHLQQGRLTPAGLNAYLKDLPDVASEGEYVNVQLGGDSADEADDT